MAGQVLFGVNLTDYFNLKIPVVSFFNGELFERSQKPEHFIETDGM